MLEVCCTYNYHLIIPPQYYDSITLRSFQLLNQCFYLKDDPLYYQNALRYNGVYAKEPFFELLMRGCLVRTKSLSQVVHWQYIDTEHDERYTISQSIEEYLPSHSPFRAFFKNRTNHFFHLVPLQCLIKCVHFNYRDFLERDLKDSVSIVGLTKLTSLPILNSTQLTRYYQGTTLSNDLIQTLVKHGVYYFEELHSLDKTFLDLYPNLRRINLQNSHNMPLQRFFLNV